MACFVFVVNIDVWRIGYWRLKTSRPLDIFQFLKRFVLVYYFGIYLFFLAYFSWRCLATLPNCNKKRCGNVVKTFLLAFSLVTGWRQMSTFSVEVEHYYKGLKLSNILFVKIFFLSAQWACLPPESCVPSRQTSLSSRAQKIEMARLARGGCVGAFCRGTMHIDIRHLVFMASRTLL